MCRHSCNIGATRMYILEDAVSQLGAGQVKDGSPHYLGPEVDISSGRCDSLQRLSLGVRIVALTALFVATPIIQLLNINKCDSLTVDNYCFQLNKFV